MTPGDVGELARTIGDLLDDPERRARMGRAGRVRAQELFSGQAVATATAAAYQRVIEDFKVSTGSTTVGEDHADR